MKTTLKIKDNPNSWGLWYTPDEMMNEAPPGAPDWVKPHWEPLPKEYTGFGATKSIECSPPNSALMIGGPQDGLLYHLGANSPEVQIANEVKGFGLLQEAEIVGTYVLEKEAWNFNGMHYHRTIYRFKSNQPELKKSYPKISELPAMEKSPQPEKAYWGKYSNDLELTEIAFEPELNQKISFKDEIFESYTNPKNYKNYTVASTGTHTTTTFTPISSMSPTLQTLYGEAANLDPFEEPEEEEPALWEQI